MNDFLAQYFTELSQLFSNSQQRLYWGYILCALAISYLWSIKNLCVWRRQNVINALGIKHFFSRSAFADYKIILINKALFLLFVPLLITKLSIATSVFELLHYSVSQPSSLENVLPTSIVIALFTLFLFLLDDFARFYFHKKMHDIAWLWAFHKTHHSATTLTPLTVLRTHPVEGIIFAIRSALVQGVSIGLFIYFFSSQVDLYTVLKVNVLVFIFHVTGSNLRHSHVAIHYWKWLESFIISPAQHQVHHSSHPKHFNKNYGAFIAVWDKLAGSHYYSEKNQRLHFGLNSTQSVTEHSLYALYIAAFTLKKASGAAKKKPKIPLET